MSPPIRRINFILLVDLTSSEIPLKVPGKDILRARLQAAYMTGVRGWGL